MDTTEQTLNRVLDDILRQVVCDCGNFRHHGVGWMPEGSGEGRSVARMILLKWVTEGQSYSGKTVCQHMREWLECDDCCGRLDSVPKAEYHVSKVPAALPRHCGETLKMVSPTTYGLLATPEDHTNG